MCLAIPMTIVKINGNRATAALKGVEQEVDVTLIPDIQLNEKVLVHAGFAIEKVDEETAREITELLDELNEHADELINQGPTL